MSEFGSARDKQVILLVDDNEDDTQLAKRALDRTGLDYQVFAVSSGLEAMSYLSGDAPYHDRIKYPLPSLVLLDIKMPVTDGFEVLRWVRHQPEFSRLCVVMLTSSDQIRDVNRAYQLGATSFLVKPLDFGNVSELSRSFEKLLAKAHG